MGGERRSEAAASLFTWPFSTPGRQGRADVGTALASSIKDFSRRAMAERRRAWRNGAPSDGFPLGLQTHSGGPAL